MKRKRRTGLMLEIVSGVFLAVYTKNVVKEAKE